MKKQLLSLVLAVLPLVMHGQNYHKQIDQYLKAQVAVHEFSGTVLVAKKGEILYQNAFGLANREWAIPNTLDTRFPIASLTKQFTAAAILQLEEQGKLSTTDKLSKYFTNYPKGEEVTLHMLLNHTSGIKNCTELPSWFAMNPNIPVAQLQDTLVSIIRNQPYDYEPGTFWKYSNSGYILLGYIIEKVAGETYAHYIQKNLLNKAGMHNSGTMTQDAIVPKFANGYNLTKNVWKKADFEPINIVFSAGNMYATNNDLLLWRKALLSGKVISKASLQKMNTPNHPGGGSGYGIFIDQLSNHQVQQHQGALSGYNSYMGEFVDDGICVIILTNRDTNLEFIPKGLAAILFDKEVKPAYKRQPVTVLPEVVKKYVGNYEAQGVPYPIHLIEKEGKLYLKLHRDIELIPESETKFYIDEPDVELQIEFVNNNTNPMMEAFFIEAGVKTPIKKG